MFAGVYLTISLLSIFVFVPGSRFEGGAVLNEVECWRTQRSFKSFFTHQFSGNVDVTLILVPPFSGGCEVEVAGDSSARCAIGIDLAGENWSPNSTYTWQSFGGRLSVDSTFLGSAHGSDLAGRSDHSDKASTKNQWTINVTSKWHHKKVR